MKGLVDYISESKNMTLSIELSSVDEMYNLFNALYTEYLKFKSENRKDFMKSYEGTYDKLRKAAKNAGVELDADYDKNLSKVNL